MNAHNFAVRLNADNILSRQTAFIDTAGCDPDIPIVI